MKTEEFMSRKGYLTIEDWTDAIELGFIDSTSAIRMYVACQIRANQHANKTYYASERHLAEKFGVSPNVVCQTIKRCKSLYREGKQGQRKRAYRINVTQSHVKESNVTQSHVKGDSESHYKVTQSHVKGDSESHPTRYNPSDIDLVDIKGDVGSKKHQQHITHSVKKTHRKALGELIVKSNLKDRDALTEYVKEAWSIVGEELPITEIDHSYFKKIFELRMGDEMLRNAIALYIQRCSERMAITKSDKFTSNLLKALPAIEEEIDRMAEDDKRAERIANRKSIAQVA